MMLLNTSASVGTGRREAHQTDAMYQGCKLLERKRSLLIEGKKSQEQRTGLRRSTSRNRGENPQPGILDERKREIAGSWDNIKNDDPPK